MLAGIQHRQVNTSAITPKRSTESKIKESKINLSDPSQNSRINDLASYPGLPIFFNVLRKKIGNAWSILIRRACISPPTRPCNLLYVYRAKRASQYRGTVYKPGRLDRENCQQKDNGWSSGLTLHLEEESLDSNLQLAASSLIYELTFLACHHDQWHFYNYQLSPSLGRWPKQVTQSIVPVSCEKGDSQILDPDSYFHNILGSPFHRKSRKWGLHSAIHF